MAKVKTKTRKTRTAPVVPVNRDLQTLEVCLKRVELDTSKAWFQNGKLYRDDHGVVFEVFHSPFHPRRLIRGASLDDLAMKLWQDRVGYRFGKVLR